MIYLIYSNYFMFHFLILPSTQRKMTNINASKMENLKNVIMKHMKAYHTHAQ